MVVPVPPGLRERKKARTRQEISGVATRLFAEHGFEQVTLAQIAFAAEVSVKTIFNHFGSKEDLYFDRADELRESIVGAIRERPPGTTILSALEGLLVDNLVPFRGRGWDGLEDAERFAAFKAFLATQDRSPALRARRLTLGEELGAALAAVVAGEVGREEDDPAVRALAAMVVAALQLRDAVLRAVVAADGRPEVVRARVTAVVRETFARLGTAFADLDAA